MAKRSATLPAAPQYPWATKFSGIGALKRIKLERGLDDLLTADEMLLYWRKHGKIGPRYLYALQRGLIGLLRRYVHYASLHYLEIS